ncbi:MAG TPA: ABC transporter substrate-binding protein [Thermoanaerobaculia bacterium]|jgi:peptide/nickel transport system substrate-binding protein|nr:ABC transporter substrate-binding protein [Thermoanaerobaculia bacterium]
MNSRRCFAILGMLVLLSACGGEHGTGGGGSANDTLVIALMTSPTNIDARVGNDNASGRVFDLIYSGLIKVTPDMGYAPDLAEKWETPDDKTIIFHLNPNAKFQNGQPVKASDVKWTYDSLMAPGFVSSKKSGYDAVDHIEAPDDHTVVFKLKEPNAGIFANLTLGILPMGADTNVYRTHPIGAGPYKVVDFRPDDRVVLEAFDQWVGGTPHIKHVILRIIPDATTRVLELRRGTVNFEVNSIPFENINEFTNKPQYKVVRSPGSVYQYIAFNLRDPILAKLDVRRAVAQAIDRERIIRDIMRGYAEPTETMLARGHWARANDLPPEPYDPAKARQLLARAGYKNGFSVVFKTSQDAEANQRAEVIQQMLKQVGINMQIQSNEMSTFFADIQKGNFQLYSLSRNGVQDPDFYSVIFDSKNLPPEGQNRGSYQNPEVDKLLQQGRSTFDQAKRRQAYVQVQKILQQDLPYISLYLQDNVAVMRSNIDGYVQYPAGFLLSVPQMTMH